MIFLVPLDSKLFKVCITTFNSYSSKPSKDFSFKTPKARAHGIKSSLVLFRWGFQKGSIPALIGLGCHLILKALLQAFEMPHFGTLSFQMENSKTWLRFPLGLKS